MLDSTQSQSSNRKEPLSSLQCEERLKLVRPAMVFKDTGKWKYDVWLQYEPADYDGWGGWDLWSSAKAALKRATDNGISGVSFNTLPAGWIMVVPMPYGISQHPILIKN